MAATSEPAPLSELAVGDVVAVKRNLDHPAWTKRVPCDPRNGSDITWVRNPDLPEDIGTGVVTERREIAADEGWRGHEAKTLVRLRSGFWYDCATGLQDNSGATRIERIEVGS